MSASSLLLRRSKSILRTRILSLRSFSSTTGFGLPPLSPPSPPLTLPSFSPHTSSSSSPSLQYLGGDTNSDEIEEEKRFEAAEAKREEFRQRKGRGWSDPWEIEDMMDAGDVTYESLPDWAPHHVSRISQERVKVFQREKETVIPTLQEIAQLSTLPTVPRYHPADKATLYALQRKRNHYQYIAHQVQQFAGPKILQIRKMSDEMWGKKQEAVDILFEELEMTLREKETILGRHPKFGSWVERALEEYLRTVQKEKNDGEDEKKKEEKQPLFMDVFSQDKDTKEEVIPTILNPMQVTPRKPTIGRMIEEWELSALKTSRRIMIRECTRKIAQAVIAPTPKRVIVHGREGMGKSAALSAIVAAARSSSDNAIVLYLPDGDQMHRNSFFCEPNERRKELYDLPVLQKHVCEYLLASHKKQLGNIRTATETMERFMTESQLQSFTAENEKSELTLAEVLKYGADNLNSAAACYAVAIDVLMTQDETDFIVVMDEFNCFLQKSMYYHEHYDEDVRLPIPQTHITLLKPFLDAVAITATAPSADDETAEEHLKPSRPPVLMKRGCIVVGTTESHAVRRSVTDHFLQNAQNNNDSNLVVVQVPRLSKVEVDHMVANYEATGVGKLRLDKGATVMNEQEMEYLRMVSGGEPLKLMNACMM